MAGLESIDWVRVLQCVRVFIDQPDKLRIWSEQQLESAVIAFEAATPAEQATIICLHLVGLLRGLPSVQASQLFHTPSHFSAVSALVAYTAHHGSDILDIQRLCRALLPLPIGGQAIAMVAANLPNQVQAVVSILCEALTDAASGQTAREVLDVVCSNNPGDALMVRSELCSRRVAVELVLQITTDHVRDVAGFAAHLMHAGNTAVMSWVGPAMAARSPGGQHAQQAAHFLQALVDATVHESSSGAGAVTRHVQIWAFLVANGVTLQGEAVEQLLSIWQKLAYTPETMGKFAVPMLFVVAALTGSCRTQMDSRIVAFTRSWLGLPQQPNKWDGPAAVNPAVSPILLHFSVQLHIKQFGAAAESLQLALSLHHFPAPHPQLLNLTASLISRSCTPQELLAVLLRLPPVKNFSALTFLEDSTKLRALHSLLSACLVPMEALPAVTAWVLDQANDCTTPVHALMPGIIEWLAAAMFPDRKDAPSCLQQQHALTIPRVMAAFSPQALSQNSAGPADPPLRLLSANLGANISKPLQSLGANIIQPSEHFCAPYTRTSVQNADQSTVEECSRTCAMTAAVLTSLLVMCVENAALKRGLSGACVYREEATEYGVMLAGLPLGDLATYMHAVHPDEFQAVQQRWMQLADKLLPQQLLSFEPGPLWSLPSANNLKPPWRHLPAPWRRHPSPVLLQALSHATGLVPGLHRVSWQDLSCVLPMLKSNVHTEGGAPAVLMCALLSLAYQARSIAHVTPAVCQTAHTLVNEVVPYILQDHAHQLSQLQQCFTMWWLSLPQSLMVRTAPTLLRLILQPKVSSETPTTINQAGFGATSLGQRSSTQSAGQDFSQGHTHLARTLDSFGNAQHGVGNTQSGNFVTMVQKPLMLLQQARPEVWQRPALLAPLLQLFEWGLAAKMAWQGGKERKANEQGSARSVAGGQNESVQELSSSAFRLLTQVARDLQHVNASTSDEASVYQADLGGEVGMGAHGGNQTQHDGTRISILEVTAKVHDEHRGCEKHLRECQLLLYDFSQALCWGAPELLQQSMQ